MIAPKQTDTPVSWPVIAKLQSLCVCAWLSEDVCVEVYASLCVKGGCPKAALHDSR